MLKKAFLANHIYKQAFMYLLSDEMQQAGIQTQHARGDADYMIATIGCQSAASRHTVVVADDTDVFILMVFHTDTVSQSKLYMQPPLKKSLHYPVKRKP